MDEQKVNPGFARPFPASPPGVATPVSGPAPTAIFPSGPLVEVEYVTQMLPLSVLVDSDLLHLVSKDRVYILSEFGSEPQSSLL